MKNKARNIAFIRVLGFWNAAMMRTMRPKWQRRMGVIIDLGIGINTAEAVVGTISSEEFAIIRFSASASLSRPASNGLPGQ